MVITALGKFFKTYLSGSSSWSNILRNINELNSRYGYRRSIASAKSGKEKVEQEEGSVDENRIVLPEAAHNLVQLARALYPFWNFNFDKHNRVLATMDPDEQREFILSRIEAQMIDEGISPFAAEQNVYALRMRVDSGLQVIPQGAGGKYVSYTPVGPMAIRKVG